MAERPTEGQGGEERELAEVTRRIRAETNLKAAKERLGQAEQEVERLQAIIDDASGYWNGICEMCGKTRRESAPTCSAAHLDVASYHLGKMEAEKKTGERTESLRRIVTAADLLVGQTYENGTFLYAEIAQARAEVGVDEQC
jgi:hypothetical protein